LGFVKAASASFESLMSALFQVLLLVAKVPSAHLPWRMSFIL